MVDCAAEKDGQAMSAPRTYTNFRRSNSVFINHYDYKIPARKFPTSDIVAGVIGGAVKILILSGVAATLINSM